MRTLANILWYFPCFGFIDAFLIFLLGCLLVVTVVGAPLGMGLIQLSSFLLAPFSRCMIDKSDLNIEENKYWKSFGLIVRIVYIPFGLLISILVILQCILLCISIIGIPIAVILAKSLSTFFNPVNKKCIPVSVSKEL